ncbi:c-type cytochrome [Neisseria chenwenguii]|uniref:Cytochrome c family protein n=1 Tax=Neisseria chenwenguii TaxID=1853278 RepID=A0A220S336_9NEIS|nr:cytochrome c [Neisseria chenwenguii]ASK27909.1 cytochrome c family protein [Neisseria chenwenguii]ROV56234.1 cytochrome c [Neisseria chenwenguii]
MKHRYCTAWVVSALTLTACGDRPSEKAASAPAAPPSASAVQTPATASSAAANVSDGLSKQIKLGKAVYEKNCIACHGAEGLGREGMFPPLAKADYFAKDPKKIVQAVINGVNGQITVNGKTYNGTMFSIALNDEDTANAATYILNSFGNAGGQISAADVAAERAKQ